MADEEEGPIITHHFPSAPPFYRSFTRENQARLEQFKKDVVESAADEPTTELSASQLLSLPPELRYLVPPAPPNDDEEYRVFNIATKGRSEDPFDAKTVDIKAQLDFKSEVPPVDPILPGWEYERLYPTPPESDHDATTQSQRTLDRQNYLLRFSRSILLNYLELLGILMNNPTDEDKNNKLKDILTLVANMHALVNEYRPHQARESLIIQMEKQLERKKAEVEAVKELKKKVEENMADFAKTSPDGATGDVAEDAATLNPNKRRRQTQRQMWSAMDELLGH